MSSAKIMVNKVSSKNGPKRKLGKNKGRDNKGGRKEGTYQEERAGRQEMVSILPHFSNFWIELTVLVLLSNNPKR